MKSLDSTGRIKWNQCETSGPIGTRTNCKPPRNSRNVHTRGQQQTEFARVIDASAFKKSPRIPSGANLFVSYSFCVKLDWKTLSLYHPRSMEYPLPWTPLVIDPLGQNEIRFFNEVKRKKTLLLIHRSTSFFLLWVSVDNIVIDPLSIKTKKACLVASSLPSAKSKIILHTHPWTALPTKYTIVLSSTVIGSLSIQITR